MAVAHYVDSGGGGIPAMTGASELGVASIALLIVGFLLIIILATIAGILTYFALYLIADKRAELGDALAVGYRAANMNFWSILGLLIFVGLIAGVSAIPFGLGLFFTIPWSIAVMVKAYEQLFSLSTVAPQSEE